MQRYLVIRAYAKFYRVSAVQAREELDSDPEHLGLLIMDLDTYLTCKRDFDHAKNLITDLKHWDGSPYLTLVETHTFDLREARLAREAEAHGR